MQFLGIKSEADRPIGLEKGILLVSSVPLCLRGKNRAALSGNQS
jgi:hypothetical protein